MEGLNKFNVIADLIPGKQGYFTAELHWCKNQWYIECWINNKEQILYDGFTENLNKTLDEIIEKLGANTND